MRKIKLLSVNLVVFCGVIFLTHAVAWAGLRVGPTKHDLKIPPGETQTIQLHLANTSRTDRVHVRLYLTDYHIEQSGSLAFPAAGTSEDSLATWLKIEDTDVVLNPGEKRSVACRFTVPKSARGEKHGVIMVERVFDKKRIADSGDKFTAVVATGYRIGCTVMLTVDGTKLLKKGDITDLAVNVPTADVWMESREIEVVAVFRNTGDVRMSQQMGEAVIIHKKLRKIVARLPLTAKSTNIFPDALRDYKGHINEPLRPGEYAVQASFDIGEGRRQMPRASAEFIITPELAQAMKNVFYGDDAFSGIPVIRVEPQVMELEVPGGGFRRSLITVENVYEEPIHVLGYIKDLQFQPDGEIQLMEPGSVERSCADWVTVRPAEFNLSPGASKKIQLSIRIPDGEDGGHYGKLVFDTYPLSAEASGLEPDTSLGSTLMVIVPGASEMEGTITGFEPSLTEDGKPSGFTMAFNNTGNVHVRPTGVIMVKDYMGDVLHEQFLEKDVPSILPGNSRQLKEVYNGEKLLPGEYTATVVIDYGGETDARADCKFTITAPDAQSARVVPNWKRTQSGV